MVNNENLIKEAREHGEKVGTGQIWDTYIWDRDYEDDIACQELKEDNDWRFYRAKAAYELVPDKLSSPNIQQVQDDCEDRGFVFEKVGDQSLKEKKKELEGIEEDTEKYNEKRETYLKALENAGRELAHIHSVEGQGYGWFDKRKEGPEENWEDYLEDELGNLKKRELNGRFQRAAELGYENFDVEELPEDVEPSLLHNDYNAGNIMVAEDGKINVIDFDNAVFGDARFGYVHAKNQLCDHDDSEAIERFKQGYNTEENLDIDEETKENYEALSILFSVWGGKWMEENRNVDFLDDYAENVNGRAEKYFA